MYVYQSVLRASLCLCVYKLWGKVDDVRIHTDLHWLAFLILFFFLCTIQSYYHKVYLSICLLAAFVEGAMEGLLLTHHCNVFSSHAHKSLSSAPLMIWPMFSYSLIVVFSSLIPSPNSLS